MNPHVLPARGLHAPNPTGTLVVLLAIAVPEELNLDAAVLVRPDFLARRTDHNRRLRSLDDGLGRDARRAQHDRIGNAGKSIAVGDGGGVGARRVAFRPGGMADRGDHIGLALFGGANVVVHRKRSARAEASADAGAGDDVVGHLLFLHTDLDFRVPLVPLDVFARVIENLVALVFFQINERLRVHLQVGLGLLEIVVRLAPLARVDTRIGAPSP